ncbi:amino acid adenylation domain-containing protein [Jeongeupia wiesaeckerbachi]|uniref:Pls/PosA family non-ribosomal peptide synthetase n=1 Tax=Jeongeupia wiesaeckerbachi TaxID=3051218 RepID=UPI003D8040A0
MKPEFNQLAHDAWHARGPRQAALLRDETLPDLLEATAAAQPEQIALISGNRQLTYIELDRLSALAAHHLLEAGIEPGRIVGLWLPRGVELLVMQAAITKAGAAWLPFDADTPVERIRTCLEDADAAGLVSCDALMPQLAGLGLPVWTFEALQRRVDGAQRRRNGHTPEHTAYVIYTSGSTGKPKGIAISHRSICHFLRSENAVLGVRGDDKVYQGFSVAFDMSFEEIWISYLVGATLWLAPKEIVADPDALPAALGKHGITVLHCVPTLLSLFSHDVPGLRIINLGGEMCPDTLVERFATPDRQLFNTYGPTEATVSASLAQLQRGQPVTIGKPLPNYGLLVINEAGEIVPPGETGELCITGPGVAAGYLGRPELTAEKFVTPDWGERMYRTGDLARIDEHGQVHCLGRADDQVKVRGFRVELGEIEAALAEQAHVGTVAVSLKPVAGIDQLVAYLVADGPLGRIDAGALRQALRDRLPPYMLPALFVTLATMPRLLSGKIDRKALKALPVTFEARSSESDEPSGEVETALFAALATLFPGQPLRFADDFFADLGGHSLLAARLVSTLRAIPALATTSVQDVYQHRTLGAIAAALSAKGATQAGPSRTKRRLSTRPLARIACGAAQLATLPALIGLRMLMWLVPFLVYHVMTGSPGDSLPLAVLSAIGAYIAANVLSFAVPVAAKWLLLGRVRPGRYPLWGSFYFRWWLTDRLTDLPPKHLLSNSPLHRAYLRLLGAKIGFDAQLGAISVRAPDLLHIGTGASVGASVNLENVRVDGEELVVGSIVIGERGYIGSYCAMHEDCIVGAGARLDGLSALPPGGHVPAGEAWAGSPARRTGVVDAKRLPPRPAHSRGAAAFELVLHFVCAALVSAVFFLPVFPSFMLIDLVDANWLDLTQNHAPAAFTFVTYLLLALPASAVLVVMTVCIGAALRWLVLGRLKPGRWSVHSALYHRKWIANLVQESSLAVLHGLYATVYAPWWYRMLGAKVGRNAEISTAMGVVPDMLTLGDETFIADAVMLGDEEIDQGWMSIKPTVIGHRSFVGNGAYVPDGTTLPPGVLVGVQSRAPAEPKSGDTWMGSPPMLLPAREQTQSFPESLTFKPPVWRRIARGAIEALRIVLPTSVVIAAGYLMVTIVEPYAELNHWGAVAGLLCLFGLIYGVGTFALVAALKWLLIGRYRPRAVSMWTPFVWTSEAITNVYESIAVPNFVNFLRGTPWLPWAFRALGARVGRNVWLDTTDMTEFDCVEIGDGAVLGAACGPQTHLFEDRVMKIGRVNIGAGVHVGTRSTVLYNGSVGADAELGPLTLVSKGEDIPAGTRWMGSPAGAWPGTQAQAAPIATPAAPQRQAACA